MNNKLKFQQNSQIVMQQKKQIIKAVLSQIRLKGRLEIGIFKEKVMEGKSLSDYSLFGIEYLTVEKRRTTDYGWLVHPILWDNSFPYDKRCGKVLQGIVSSKTNKRKGDNSTFIRCRSSKNRNLLVINIREKGSYKENFLIIDNFGKIFHSEYAQIFAANWDENSVEAKRDLRECQERNMHFLEF